MRIEEQKKPYLMLVFFPFWGTSSFRVLRERVKLVSERRKSIKEDKFNLWLGTVTFSFLSPISKDILGLLVILLRGLVSIKKREEYRKASLCFSFSEIFILPFPLSLRMCTGPLAILLTQGRRGRRIC